MKKIATSILATVVLIGSSATLLPPKTQAMEPVSPTVEKEVNPQVDYTTVSDSAKVISKESQVLLKEEVQGSGDHTAFVNVPDGPVYTWDYVGTTKGNNVFYNESRSWLSKALMAGISATIVGQIGTAFWAGVAGYAMGSVKLPKDKNYWWKVKKWMDSDSKYYYFKYEIKIYSNSSRTKLVDSYFTIERAS
ncbi:hypothetical protein [Metabacillus arenae]|uniref:Uncharacterized protein n=1 Tax=Metabacillus arenae TaxID=2771434 RepID=A0A926RWP4_9BACI|nr:hypothetical protein [Metabacillus arenae]MBD1381018.1 hypothetical protein [Metabacillus arenae]